MEFFIFKTCGSFRATMKVLKLFLQEGALNIFVSCNRKKSTVFNTTSFNIMVED